MRRCSAPSSRTGCDDPEAWVWLRGVRRKEPIVAHARLEPWSFCGLITQGRFDPLISRTDCMPQLQTALHRFVGMGRSWHRIASQ